MVVELVALLLLVMVGAARLEFCDVEFVSHATINFDIEMSITECFECPPMPISAPVAPNSSVWINNTIQAYFPTVVTFRLLNGSVLNQFTEHFGDQGVYRVAVNDTGGFDVATVVDPLNGAIPIVVGAFSVAVVLVAILLLECFISRRRSGMTDKKTAGDMSTDGVRINSPTDSTTIPVIVPKKQRLNSLDVMRGISILTMIFVNYGGGGYWFFNHSSWNGLTFADLVFPWFIFMMGIAMSFTRLREALSVAVFRVLKRSAKLMCLGLFLNNMSELFTGNGVRLPGVLQRFGVAYLIVSLIALVARPRGKRNDDDDTDVSNMNVFKQQLVSMRTHALEWLFGATLVATWLLVTLLLPVPGCPTGYLGAGGLMNGAKYFNCTGGAAGFVDQQVFGLKNIYHTPTCQLLYHCGIYDPEGLVGNLTSVFLCLLGLQCGYVFVETRRATHRIVRLALFGSFWCLVGGALCGFSQNVGFIPINKNLWSLSFVCVMAGTGALLLGAVYVLVDHTKLWSGRPFLFVGMNSIVLYCGSELLERFFPFSFVPPVETHGYILASNLIGVSCWALIAWHLKNEGIFITI